MKRLSILAGFALGLLLALPAVAVDPIYLQRGSPGISGQRVPAGFEQLSLSTGSSTALAAIPAATTNTPPIAVTLAVICVEGNAVRFRDDATAPTAAIGMPIPVGGCWNYTGNPAALRFIRQSASTATLNVNYYY